MADAESTVNNGVNVEALLGAREALTEAPEAAQFKWRATCDWINGTHSKSSVTSFFGLGEEQNHRAEYTFDADHPEVFASEDNGATPVELVLVVGTATGLISLYNASTTVIMREVDPAVIIQLIHQHQEDISQN